MITFRDMKKKSKSIISSSEDFNDVTYLIPQRNKNSISEKKKELEETISNKNEEILV